MGFTPTESERRVTARNPRVNHSEAPFRNRGRQAQAMGLLCGLHVDSPWKVGGYMLTYRECLDLVQWLSELSRMQNKKEWGQPRTFRYWSIPAYALAHNMKKASLMKRLRELEKIARQKFPDSVPSFRKARAPLTEKEIQEMREQYLAGVDAKKLAEQFRIPASYVGRLCHNEKLQRMKESDRRREEESQIAESQPQTDSLISEEETPF